MTWAQSNVVMPRCRLLQLDSGSAPPRGSTALVRALASCQIDRTGPPEAASVTVISLSVSLAGRPHLPFVVTFDVDFPIRRPRRLSAVAASRRVRWGTDVTAVTLRVADLVAKCSHLRDF